MLTIQQLLGCVLSVFLLTDDSWLFPEVYHGLLRIRSRYAPFLPQVFSIRFICYVPVFWGAAIVFFLARFINLHNPEKQGFWVEVSSQVENGIPIRLLHSVQALTTLYLSLVYSHWHRIHTFPCSGYLQ